MNRQKLLAAAWALPLLGFFLLFSPLLRLFPPNIYLGGVPVEVIYIFAAWFALIVGAFCLARALGSRTDDPDSDLGEDAPP
jgi:hypothetical protein